MLSWALKFFYSTQNFQFSNEIQKKLKVFESTFLTQYGLLFFTIWTISWSPLYWIRPAVKTKVSKEGTAVSYIRLMLPLLSQTLEIWVVLCNTMCLILGISHRDNWPDGKDSDRRTLDLKHDELETTCDTTNGPPRTRSSERWLQFAMDDRSEWRSKRETYFFS